MSRSFVDCDTAGQMGSFLGAKMKHPATRELFAYWNDLRGDRSAPERSAIDPAAIRGILADTFMLDVDLEHRFPLRLAGTRVNALFDTELKGRSFLDIWRIEERRNVAALLMTVADGACPVVAGAAATPNGSEHAVEMMFLPLRHRGRTHSRILGLIKLTRGPDWFGTNSLGPLSLRAMRIVDADEMERRQTRRPHAERLPLGSIGRTADGIQLRVIQGGLVG